MRDYKYILFDLGGTLTDPKEGITKSVAYALKHFGIDVEDWTHYASSLDHRSRILLCNIMD